jgi:ADP-ribose pyrophosphatase YjhB (NUDIX family)
MLDGMWSLPGGWADVNEAPSAMVEREVWEEAGLRVKARKLAGVYEANHDRDPVNALHSYKLLFLCEYQSGELQTSYETPDVRYFDLDDLPELSIHRTHQRHIREAFAHLQQPDRPAAFD